jgi:hypothetical protein
MMRRTAVYKKFKKHEKDIDKRSMDELCGDVNTDFLLQAQQEFLKEYVVKNKSWSKMLLYHLAGSGKTCTAITMAEVYKQLNPTAKVTVILPARLKTNFIDELISPCGMNNYISPNDFEVYRAPDTPEATKNGIRKRFISAINAEYNIITFDGFRRLAKNATSLTEFVSDFSTNSMIIVDEVHNLISDKYNIDHYKQMVEDDRLPGYVKGSWAMLFRFMNESADKSCKMIYLTASPIFDNLKQLYELVILMSPEAIDKISIKSKLSTVIEYLRGKVSYFPGTSLNAFPTKVFSTHNVKITEPMDEMVFHIQEEKRIKDTEETEAFLVRERQALVSVYPASHTKMQNATKADIKLFAPKVAEMIVQIEALIGKHVVYSTFIDKGLEVVELGLRLNGWRAYGEKGAKAYKTYCMWDGRLVDADKETYKTALNHIDNMDGRYLKLVLGSPSIKEGVSFKHVQHLHMLDPVWNGSAMMQIEARAIRFCSHIDIPATGSKGLERKVVIHYYRTVPMDKGGRVVDTADQYIYDSIIPRKKQLVAIGESALQKVAIDYYLFRKMYRAPESLSPVASSKVSVSPVGLKHNVVLNEYSVEPDNIPRKPKCGKAKMPVNGACTDGYHMRANKHGDNCCYKTKAKKKTSPQG